MERSGGKTVKSESKEKINDWRAEVTPEIREKIVYKLLDSLKESFPAYVPNALYQLNEFCLKLEQNAFCNATTKDFYLHTIANKKKQIEESCRQNYAACSANIGLTQNSMVAGAAKSSNLQNVSWVSCDSGGGSVEQVIQPNSSANRRREILESQPLQTVVNQQNQLQESHHQFQKQNVHQPNIFTSQNQLDLHNNHWRQQPHADASLPSLFHCSQHPTLPAESWQPLFMEQSYSTAFPQNQLLIQKDNVVQEPLSPFWKTIPKSYQKPVGLQNNGFGLQQPQRIIGPQANIMNLQSCQYSAHILQQVEDKFLEHKLQQRMQPVQFHQPLDAEKQSTQEAAQRRLQTLATLLEPQTVINQQKFIPSQITLAEVSSASLESTAHNELANIAGQHDQAYQMFQSMKEKYLPLLKCIQNKLNVIQKLSKPETVGIYNAHIIGVKKFINILSVPQCDMVGFSQSHMLLIEKEIIKVINFYKQNNAVSIRQHAQLLQPPGGEPQISQPQQLKNGKYQFLPMNLASKSTTVGSSPLSSAQEVGLEQWDDLRSLQHAARLADQNIVGAEQKKHLHNNTVYSFGSAINSLGQNSIINPYQQQVKHQTLKPENLKQHIQLHLIQPKMQLTNTQPLTLQSTIPTIPHQCLATSPMSQHSAQIDQQISLSPFLKAGMPLHSASSTSTTASSTLLTPFSKPQDQEKKTSVVSAVSNPEKGHLQTMIGNQRSAATKNPLERLLKAVESLTPKALSASVRAIGSVMNEVDMIAGTACNDSGTAVGEASEPEILHHLCRRNFIFQYGCLFEERMKRKISAMALDGLSSSHAETDNLKQSTGHIGDLDSTEASRSKRHRIEPYNALLNEIRFINQRLLETVVDLDKTEDTAALHEDEGTIVRCSYTAVALNESFKMHSSQILPVLPLRLLVPASYPNSSPVILDALTVDWSCDSKEPADLSEKTISRFRISLRMLSEPMSLAEIARTWDTSARAVFLEYAQLIGGECFSSRYGTWENFVAA